MLKDKSRLDVETKRERANVKDDLEADYTVCNYIENIARQEYNKKFLSKADLQCIRWKIEGSRESNHELIM